MSVSYAAHTSFFFLTIPPPPSSTLFPYTTLFRSQRMPQYGTQSLGALRAAMREALRSRHVVDCHWGAVPRRLRSEEHTSELQSRGHLVCRLLLEKKKKININ